MRKERGEKANNRNRQVTCPVCCREGPSEFPEVDRMMRFIYVQAAGVLLIIVDLVVSYSKIWTFWEGISNRRTDVTPYCLTASSCLLPRDTNKSDVYADCIAGSVGRTMCLPTVWSLVCSPWHKANAYTTSLHLINLVLRKWLTVIFSSNILKCDKIILYQFFMDGIKPRFAQTWAMHTSKISQSHC
jgi:hypothetical protein